MRGLTKVASRLRAESAAEVLFRGHPVEYWVKQARDPNAAKDVAVAALAEAVLSENPLTKVAAADALATLGPAAKDAVPALLAQLGHEQPWVRSAVMGALGAVGPDAVQPLIDTFKNQTGGPRIRAAFVLGGMGATAKPAVPVLVEEMEKENPVVQKRLADILGQIDPEHFAGNVQRPVRCAKKSTSDRATRWRCVLPSGRNSTVQTGIGSVANEDCSCSGRRAAPTAVDHHGTGKRFLDGLHCRRTPLHDGRSARRGR